jgi:hypothetical protein
MKKQNRVAKLPNSGRDLKPQITNYTSTTVSIANAPPRSFVVETLTLIFHGSKCSLGCSPSSFGPQFLMIWDVILVCQTWGYCSLYHQTNTKVGILIYFHLLLESCNIKTKF